MKQNSQNANISFPLVTTKLSSEPSAQLMLKGESGEAVQQWLISQNKCTLGSSESSTLQCQAPGIAPFHALLVVGARQIFIRALAPKLTCDGVHVNEVLLHADRNFFELAGHRFEVTRLTSSLQTDDSAGDESVVAANSDQRLKFTLARPMALQQRLHHTPNSAESKLMSVQNRNDNRWITGLIQSAVEPLECQLRNVLEPLAELQDEARRQRKLLEDQRQHEQSNAAKRLAEALDSSSVGQLSEQLQHLAVSQSAKIDLVKEKISDLNQQISTLEKVVSQAAEAEPDPQVEEAAERRAAEHSEAIHQVSNSLASVSSVLEELGNQQSNDSKSEQTWRQELDAQLGELNASLNSIKTVQEESTEVLSNHLSEQTNALLEATTAHLYSATESNHSQMDKFTQQNMQELEELRTISTRTEESLNALASKSGEELATLSTQWQECLQTLVCQVEDQHNRGDAAFGEATRMMTEELVRELETRTQQTQALVRQLGSDTSQTDWQNQIEQRVSTLQELLERLVESLNLKELAAQALAADAPDRIATATEIEASLDAKFEWEPFRNTAKNLTLDSSGLTLDFPSSDLRNPSTKLTLPSESQDDREPGPIALSSEFEFIEMGDCPEFDPTQRNAETRPAAGEAEQPLPRLTTEVGLHFGKTADDASTDHSPPDVLPSQPDGSPWNDTYDFTHLDEYPAVERQETPPIGQVFEADAVADPDAAKNLFASSWGFELPSESNLPADAGLTSNHGWEMQFTGLELTEEVGNKSWMPEDPWQLTPREDCDASISTRIEEVSAADDATIDDNRSSEEYFDSQQVSHSDDDEIEGQMNESIPVASRECEQVAESTAAEDSAEIADPDSEAFLPSWWTTDAENETARVDSGDTPEHDEPMSSEKPVDSVLAESFIDYGEHSESAETDAPPTTADLEHSPPEADPCFADETSSAREDDSTAVGQNAAVGEAEFEQQFESESLDELHEFVESGPANEPLPPFSQLEWGQESEDSPSAELESDEFWAAVETGNSHTRLPTALASATEKAAGEEINLLAEIGQHDVLTLQKVEKAAPEMTAEGGQAGSEAASEPSHEGLEEESVEAYMERLLDRVRRHDSNSAPQPIASSSTISKTSSGDSSSVTPAETEKSQHPTSSTRKTAESNSSSNPARRESRQSAGGEAAQGFAAMRELANSNARTAIHRSTRKRYATAAAIKCVLSIIAVIVGLTLLSINGLTLGIGLFAALAAFMVAAIWGYDAIASLFPIMENSLVLKPTNLRQQDVEDADPS